jgi:putative transposase
MPYQESQAVQTRGLNGVKLVISDGHKGIQKAVEKAFLGASWQMCNVHFMRAVLKNIPKKDKAEIAYKFCIRLLHRLQLHYKVQEPGQELL